ncbi:Uncharacterised protein [uncultured archaeon]|nr:Uncharacterised protein [uncultured archaeon]
MTDLLNKTQAGRKACPFVARLCLLDECTAWEDLRGCMLIPAVRGECLSPFDQKLREAAPMMYRTLLDLVEVMEEASRDCNRCGPELWNYTQEVRRSLLDELTKAKLDLQD